MAAVSATRDAAGLSVDSRAELKDYLRCPAEEGVIDDVVGYWGVSGTYYLLQH